MREAWTEFFSTVNADRNTLVKQLHYIPSLRLLLKKNVIYYLKKIEYNRTPKWVPRQERRPHRPQGLDGFRFAWCPGYSQAYVYIVQPDSTTVYQWQLNYISKVLFYPLMVTDSGL